MKAYESDKIRNVALLGHGGQGKTTLAEAMLFNAKVIDRMGKVQDGTTVSDYDPEEINRHISIGLSLLPFEYNEHKINMLDTPGFFDFAGQMREGISAADSAVIVISAVSGVDVGTKKAFELCNRNGVAKMVFINSCDRENANYKDVVLALQQQYGNFVTAIQLPIMRDKDFAGFVDLVANKAYEFDKDIGLKEIPIPSDMVNECSVYREKIIDVAAESDDNLMEKYFDGQELTLEEIIAGLRVGYCSGRICPVSCGSAVENKAVIKLMENIIFYSPSPLDRGDRMFVMGDEPVNVKCDSNGPIALRVFKSIADPFIGKLSFVKVKSGTLKNGMSIINTRTEKSEKLSNISTIRGKKTIPVDALCAGDLGVIAKLAGTKTGDMLCDASMPLKQAGIDMPHPCIDMAVYAVKQGDEEKIASGLAKLAEEDLTLSINKNIETNETILTGIGEVQLEVAIKKLKDKYNVEAELRAPQIAYRETIRKSASAEGKYKKQSGGHGQYGHCIIEFEPNEGKGFEFVDEIVGGVVPKQFIPAVEKGLKECMNSGVLAGYPVVDVKCTLKDGSYHSVDSSEMAFKSAARLAFKKACETANPVLLEPIYKFEIFVPNEYMGDVMGDLNKRRGRILGMNPYEDIQKLEAEVPLYEMFKYATDLRSMTQGQGYFKMWFERYEQCPANVAENIIAKSSKKGDSEE